MGKLESGEGVYGGGVCVHSEGEVDVRFFLSNSFYTLRQRLSLEHRTWFGWSSSQLFHGSPNLSPQCWVTDELPHSSDVYVGTGSPKSCPGICMASTSPPTQPSFQPVFYFQRYLKIELATTNEFYLNYTIPIIGYGQGIFQFETLESLHWPFGQAIQRSRPYYPVSIKQLSLITPKRKEGRGGSQAWNVLKCPHLSS